MDNEKSLNNFLYRSLEDMGMHALPNKDADSVEINYDFNSYGYRCDEFNNQEILTLGCSHTEGHGLPVDLTWPYLISQKMNKSYISLAKGGEGAQAQVIKAFQFFKEFYNPKYIFAVFPLARLEIPLIGVNSKNPTSYDIGKGLFSNNKIQKYSKSPHFVEEVLTEEFAIFYNVMFIKMLIQYCEANDIKLIWTYYKDMNTEMPSLKNMHNGFFESPYLDKKIEEKCHSEFSNNEFFDYAADHNYWPPGHWGLHQHIHIAESIYNII